MPLLEVLVLGHNEISSLKSLKNCVHLNHLSLRKNRIADLQELQHLKDAKSLNSLILAENPCSVAAGGNYRSSVLRILPQLKTLDEQRVTHKERRLLSSEPEVILPDQTSVDQGHFWRRSARFWQGYRAIVVPRWCLEWLFRECLAPSERKPGNNRSTTPRDKAIASASACVDAITFRREQELKDDISQYYQVGPELQCRDRNARLLMGTLALVREMDASTLEVLCRAIQDRVKLPT
ncbi:cilia- and flagella-associated protein 410-like [Drosophila kikkawai]|uniref:Cilia- and flagella-associated protein 410-like n=1 Tax=Drosophila kikkawai TaxID=30033 RepID=A0ABM4GQS2_DROKI